LYECLTGRPPFETGDLRQLMGAPLSPPPAPPSNMRRGINRGFDDVIATGMAKQPSERFSSTGELAKAAKAAASGVKAPTPAPALPSPPAAPALPSPPASTRQFTAVDPNPAGTGYTRYPPPDVRPPEAPPRKSRFGRSHVALVVATILLLGAAVVLAAQLIYGNR